jgi:TPR repeat protein
MLSLLPGLALAIVIAAPVAGLAQQAGDVPGASDADKAAESGPAPSGQDDVSVDERLGKTPPAAVPKQDLAYGAYQRGYYLTAFELALPRARLGDPKAQTLIAELYDRGLGVARDPKEAAGWYEIASGNGDREAHFGYAVKLLEGRHVERDADKARALLKLAADDGHATAAFNYGQLLVDERPTTAGAREALPYFEQAAARQVPDAYYALAQLYRSGVLKGYPEHETAQQWLAKAAQAGIDTAQVELGIWLANGTAGVKDEKTAFAWIQRAALGGNVVARNRLAKMLAQGIGTPINVVEAAKWHILAQRAGLDDAWLDDFINGIDRDKLSKALEAANRWP